MVSVATHESGAIMLESPDHPVSIEAASWSTRLFALFGRAMANGWTHREVLSSIVEGAVPLEPSQIAEGYFAYWTLRRSSERHQLLFASTRAMPYWKYCCTEDPARATSHTYLHGKVFHWNDPVWQDIFPPNDPWCSCRVVPVGQAAVDRDGITICDGREIDVGAVCADGWDVNPGELDISELHSMVAREMFDTRA